MFTAPPKAPSPNDFPRTIPQAETLKGCCSPKLSIGLDMVIEIDVPHDVILYRLDTYNTKTAPWPVSSASRGS